jgi:predicted NAD-dependent protein-ADP-ribosyltransferase YbiA (DUF1768 family)
MSIDDAGMRLALQKTKGAPYLWATEFENVHDIWVYKEPEITVRDKRYANSETFYHAQKPLDNAWDEWENVKDDVMREGIRAKLASDPSLHALLCATQGHPLLAIKNDEYWGFHPHKGGLNRLAQLWMELRAEFLSSALSA